MKTALAAAVFLAVLCQSDVRAQLWQQTGGPGGSVISGLNFDSAGGIYVLANIPLHSTDGGQSWQEMSFYPFGLRTLPNGDLIGFIGTTLVVSKDHGQNWASIRTFQSTQYPAVTVDGEIYIVSGSQTYRTSNEGVSWDSLPPPPNQSGTLGAFRTSTLFWVSDYMYRSTDKGFSWSKVVNGLDKLVPGPTFNLTGGSGGLMAYADRSNVWMSSDDGRTWKTIDSYIGDYPSTAIRSDGKIGVCGGVDLRLHDAMNMGMVLVSNGLCDEAIQNQLLQVAPTGEFWLALGTNLFKSDSKPSKFSFVPLPIGTVNALAATGPGTFFASAGDVIEGTFGAMLYRTRDGAKTWAGLEETGSFGQAYQNVYLPLSVDSTHALLAGLSGGVVRSSDGGATWKTLGSQLTQTKITSIVVDPSNNLFLSCGEGVFRSTDHGVTWDQLNAGFPNANILSLTVNSAGDLFAGSKVAIFESKDHAISWQPLPFAPPDSLGIMALVVNSNGDLYAGIQSGSVFVSHDGQTWSPIRSGLSGTLNALLSTPIGDVFAATSQGVFDLPAGGSAWVTDSAGYPRNLAALSLTCDASGIVYVGTVGKGVYRSTRGFNLPLSEVSQPSTNASSVSLNSIYPNPLSSAARFTFSVSESGMVRVELFDALGRCLRVLVDGRYQAGTYQSSLDASDLASGVYQLRLTCGGVEREQNVVVAR